MPILLILYSPQVAGITSLTVPPTPPATRAGVQSPVSCGATPPHSPGYPSPPCSPVKSEPKVKP